MIDELRAAAPDEHADDHRHRQPPDVGRAVLGRLRAAGRSSRPAASPAWASAPTACSALKLARPDRPAVCVTSDGSFMMFPGAVATAVEHDIPAVWVILNNYTIGVIRDLQRFYMDGREIGTSFIKQSTGEFWNPDFAKMAAGDGRGRRSPSSTRATSPRRSRRRSRRDAVRRRREGQPRHGRAADRDLAVRADPAGRAHLREARWSLTLRRPALLPVHRDRRPGAPQAGAPGQRGQPGGRRRARRGAERDRRSRPRCAGSPSCCPRSTSSPTAPSAATRPQPCASCLEREPRGRACRSSAGGGASSTCRSTRPRTGSRGRSTSRGRCARARRRSSRACSPRRTAGSSTSTRSTCSTTTSCDVLLDAAALGSTSSSARASPSPTRRGSCSSAR